MVDLSIARLLSKGQRKEIQEFIKAHPKHPDIQKVKECLENSAVSDYLAYVIIYFLSPNTDVDIKETKKSLIWRIHFSTLPRPEAYRFTEPISEKEFKDFLKRRFMLQRLPSGSKISVYDETEKIHIISIKGL